MPLSLSVIHIVTYQPKIARAQLFLCVIETLKKKTKKEPIRAAWKLIPDVGTFFFFGELNNTPGRQHTTALKVIGEGVRISDW